jgi:allantoin racemase
MRRVVIVGPTSAPWAEIAPSVDEDLRRLCRPGLEISYVTTGTGPISIRSREDELAAAPHVVEAAIRVADSCDAIVVDCTGDPGVAAARTVISVPVVGAGEAARRAAQAAPKPVMFLSGDEVRAAAMDQLRQASAGAATVVVYATGQRSVVDALRDEGIDVIEPLEAAVEWCVQLLSSTS